MRNNFLNLAQALLVCAGVAFSAASIAVPITTNPFSVIGNVDSNNTADIEFMISGQTATTLDLDVKIINTSALYSPVITGFAFNVPSEITSLTGLTFSGVSGWDALLNLDNIGTPQSFGNFDVCAEEGNNQNNCTGGNPNNGIAKGNMATFTFSFEGMGLDSLDVFSFLNEQSICPMQGDCTSVGFLARFQQTGSDGQGSDVAVPGDPPGEIPEPSVLALFGLGLLGMGFSRRKT